MTFNAIEISRFQGAPIELFTFARGNDDFFRYTSSGMYQEVGGNVFEAVAITRGKIKISQNIEKTGIKITMDARVPFVRSYVETPPAASISLSIQQFHKGDPDAEVRSVWLGRVVNVKFIQKGSFQVEVACESAFSIAKRNILNRVYGLSCPHMLYGVTNCRASPVFFQEAIFIGVVNGTTITSTDLEAFSTGYFDGGFVELIKAGTTDRRFIINQAGDTMVLNLPMSRLVPEDSLVLYPGCKHNIDDCLNKFNNLNNFGGFPFTPIKNPMGGSPIF